MIQCQCLNYILSSKDSSCITSNNLNAEYFSEYVSEFEFIKSHIDEYGNVPDIETFVAKFPDFDLVEVNESVSYLITELYADRNKRKLAGIFNKIRNLLMEDKTSDAMNLYMTAADNLVTASKIQSVDIFENKSRYDEYVNRGTDFSAHYVKTGFPELDRLIGGWDRNDELATIVARTGLGKCLAKGSEILMADGTLKKVEDVSVGDRVQSFNKVNTVIDLHNGISNGYRIVAKNGDEFTVSAGHILTCVYNYRNGMRVEEKDLVDIVIEDYINLPQKEKEKYYLFRPSVNYPKAPTHGDPYTYGCNVGFTLDSCKNIQNEYIINSSDVRFSFLSGVIDYAGVYDKKLNVISITSKNKYALSTLNRIAKSLGIYTVIGDDTLLLLKNIGEIPSKMGNRYVITEYCSVDRFNVIPVDIIEYYGFMCDGDSRYLTSDYILTHNTWTLLKTALAAAESGLTVGIYSGEMTETKVGYRIDTLLSHISNRCITHGDISVSNDYKRYLDSVKEKIKGTIKVLTPKMVGGPVGVNALRAFIERDHLDMLCIDQHSLLEDDRKARNPVEKASNISKDLKNLQVMARIPIISVSQQNRVVTENGVDTTNVAQSDRIAQDSTVVIFLEKSENNLMKYTLVKARDSENGKVLTYSVDLDKGTFTYIPEGQTQEESDALKEEYDGGEEVF